MNKVEVLKMFPDPVWHSGYEFVRDTDKGILVRQVQGEFAGVEFLFPKGYVRDSSLESEIETTQR